MFRDVSMFRALARPCRYFIEFVAAVAGVIVILGVLLIWRLSSSPMTSSFLKPYIESSIVNLVPGAHVAINNSVITWDNTDHSISLHADGLHLTDNDGDPIADLPDVEIRVSVFGLLIGRLVPSGLRIENPKVWLDRREDGTFLFGGMSAKGGGGAGSTKASLINVVDDLSHAHLMRKLQIQNAEFFIHDDKANRDWSATMKETVLERSLGGRLNGEAKMEIAQGDHKAFGRIALRIFARQEASHADCTVFRRQSGFVRDHGLESLHHQHTIVNTARFRSRSRQPA